MYFFFVVICCVNLGSFEFYVEFLENFVFVYINGGYEVVFFGFL